MRNALKTLPWVEQGKIHMNFKTRELRFAVKDMTQFNEDDLKKALKAQGFAQAEVKSRPT